MTKDKLKALIQTYKLYFKTAESRIPQRFPTDGLTNHYYKYNDLRNHCYYMIREIEKFIDNDEQKAYRWLGFIQGVLWSIGDNTINELRGLNGGN